MCIDPERFYKMEERLALHIKDNNEDLAHIKKLSRNVPGLTDDISEIKMSMRHIGGNVDNLLVQQKTAKWVVKILMGIAGIIGVLLGFALDFYQNHKDWW